MGSLTDRITGTPRHGRNHEHCGPPPTANETRDSFAGKGMGLKQDKPGQDTSCIAKCAENMIQPGFGNNLITGAIEIKESSTRS